MLNAEWKHQKFILHHSCFILLTSSFLLNRPCGAARSARLPVTQEIAGSNPVEGAFEMLNPVEISARYANFGKAAKLKPS
jgi:hypothetical protein